MFDLAIALPLLIATLGAGLVAGIYFAFSAFVMRAFDQLGPARAADAMNAVNEVILRSWFLPLFFGSTLLYALLAGYAVFDTGLAGRWWLFAAGLVYVTGMFGCTVLFNVPLNERLAAAGDDDRVKAETWQHYFVYWTRWNHLRALCSLLAVAISIQYLVSQT
jgi:uncharacterized membrane protein